MKRIGLMAMVLAVAAFCAAPVLAANDSGALDPAAAKAAADKAAAAAKAAAKPKPAAPNMDAVKEAVEKTDLKFQKPAKARKVLLYDFPNGFNHGGAIAAGRVAFPAMGAKTGAFEVVASNDLANFEADKLKEFDAIIFNNTTGELFMGKAFDQCANKPADQAEAAKLTEKYRANLVEFVKGGKGIMGIHSATDCSYNWKEWGEMMGAYFGGHPYSQIHVKIDDPGNPIIAVTGDKDFDIKDEIYIFADKGARNVYSREKVRVLCSVDVDGSKITKQAREDKDYALLWVKKFGEGRVFYCAFGHDQRMFVMPNVLQFYLSGLQFICGDLKAETTPKPLPASAKPAEK